MNINRAVSACKQKNHTHKKINEKEVAPLFVFLTGRPVNYIEVKSYG